MNSRKLADPARTRISKAGGKGSGACSNTDSGSVYNLVDQRMCQTAELDAELVRNALKAIGLPEIGTVWIGPYEQLHGAGYALLAAIRHGVHRRDLSNYHVRVRARIVQTILEHDAEGKATDEFAFDNAIAGFYFNAAIQRIVWASERLIKTFISVPCICGRKPEQNADARKFPKLLKGAKLRRDHLISEDKRTFPELSALLNQFPDEEHKRESPYDPQKALAMLRYDVNNRKHAVYDSLARDRKSASGGCDFAPTYWSDAPQDCQMHLACKSFDLVCRAYDELRDWQPNMQTGSPCGSQPPLTDR